MIYKSKGVNWIVVHEKSDSCLKCLWFDVDPWGVTPVNVKCDKLIAEKCVEDASEYIWLRLNARSVLIYKLQSFKLNCVPRPREVW